MLDVQFMLHVFRRLCEGVAGLGLVMVLWATSSSQKNLSSGPRAFVWVLALALLVFGLSGCARPVRVLCPSLVTYSAADQSTLSAELASAPLPMLHRCMRDYDGMRDQARACEAAK